MFDKKTADSLTKIPERKKTKSIDEIKKPKVEKKKEKKPKISLDVLRKIYKLAVDENLPYSDDESAERKKLITAIKKVLK
jgi:hypothetical protein